MPHFFWADGIHTQAQNPDSSIVRAYMLPGRKSPPQLLTHRPEITDSGPVW